MILEKTTYKDVFAGMGRFTYFFNMFEILKWGIYTSNLNGGHVQLFRTKKQRDREFDKRNPKSRRFKLKLPIIILEINNKKQVFLVKK